MKIDDEMTGLHETIDSLAVGETRSFTTEWTVTEEDILRGTILNRVTAKGDDVPDPKDPDHPKTPEGEDTEEDEPDDIDTTVTVIKESDVPEGKKVIPGTVVNYTITVTNEGNVTANNVLVSDQLDGLEITAGDKYTVNGNTAVITRLAQGETVIITATYEVKLEDLEAGVVHNVATATGDPIDNPKYDPEDPENPDNPKEYVPEGSGETDVEVTPEVHEIYVEYVYEDGTPARDPVIIHKEYGDTYKIVTPAMPGFTPDIAVVEGLVEHDDIHVVVTYIANIYNLTIKYVDRNGKEMADPYEDRLKSGDNYDVESPKINRYKPNLDRVTGVMPAQDTIITVIYSRVEEPTIVFDEFDTPLGLGFSTGISSGDCYE